MLGPRKPRVQSLFGCNFGHAEWRNTPNGPLNTQKSLNIMMSGKFVVALPRTNLLAIFKQMGDPKLDPNI